MNLETNTASSNFSQFAQFLNLHWKPAGTRYNVESLWKARTPYLRERELGDTLSPNFRLLTERCNLRDCFIGYKQCSTWIRGSCRHDNELPVSLKCRNSLSKWEIVWFSKRVFQLEHSSWLFNYLKFLYLETSATVRVSVTTYQLRF
jgi:hypothetical protein